MNIDTLIKATTRDETQDCAMEGTLKEDRGAQDEHSWTDTAKQAALYAGAFFAGMTAKYVVSKAVEKLL